MIAAAPQPSQDSLRVCNLTKAFGGLRVFDDISFELAPGEILGVIGPNGAGKTTLINCMCGMVRPTSGRVLLGAEQISGRRFDVVSRLQIQRSFQQTNTFRSASVEENLYRADRFSAMKGGVDLKLPNLLEEFGLARHLDEPSDKLPYGLQKMLGLLMVLIGRPRFLLLDEPAAGLERRERQQIDRYVEHARSLLGCGILVVEHDMDLVKRLCPRAIVLEAGRLLADGSPAEVLSRQDVMNAYLGVNNE